MKHAFSFENWWIISYFISEMNIWELQMLEFKNLVFEWIQYHRMIILKLSNNRSIKPAWKLMHLRDWELVQPHLFKIHWHLISKLLKVEHLHYVLSRALKVPWWLLSWILEVLLSTFLVETLDWHQLHSVRLKVAKFEITENPAQPWLPAILMTNFLVGLCKEGECFIVSSQDPTFRQNLKTEI